MFQDHFPLYLMYHTDIKSKSSDGLFRQSLNGNGTGTNRLTWYYMEVFTLQLQLYLYLYFGIVSVPVLVQYLVLCKFLYD